MVLWSESGYIHNEYFRYGFVEIGTELKMIEIELFNSSSYMCEYNSCEGGLLGLHAVKRHCNVS